MEKAKITRTYVISADTIIYQDNLQSYPISVEDIKQESDVDRLHHKMPEFLNDLCSITHELRDVEIPSGQNWEEKVIYTCRKFFTVGNNQLHYYYTLGALLEEKLWNKEAKKITKKRLPHTKANKILLAAKRTYILYSTRGPSYLYLSQCITLMFFTEFEKKIFCC
ncbi:hypothetical protein C2G38_2032454 [Gigaspora rosea]|uniref:Uncharacterized protein n=1 Tax=Gigaspora rosea TaxID=44941 RepID=A0A397VRV9_9GLOM|nr:hypothetical protein C2G38_2032454 [Gigaspora rosea]